MIDAELDLVLLQLGVLSNQHSTYFLGIDRPGQIIYFDHKGEVMDTSDFQPELQYLDQELEGGLGMHEIGNRGTRHGLNMYTNNETNEEQVQGGAAKYVPATPSGSSTIPKSEMMEVRPSLEKSSDPPNLVTTLKEPSNELATKELNLLAQLIGADILANEQQTNETFKINLFDKDAQQVEEENEIK